MRLLSFDTETNISQCIHGPTFRQPSNDVYTQIWCSDHESASHVIHKTSGFNRQLEYGFKQALKQCTHIIGHNLSFDLCYFWHTKELKEFILRGGKILDTQVIEYLLTGQQHQFSSLAELQLKYLGEVEKPNRISKLYKKGIGADKIVQAQDRCQRIWKLYNQYCESDGRTPLLIVEKQLERLKAENMLPIAELYNDYLLSLINMTCSGIKVDVLQTERTLQEFNLKHLEYLEEAQNILKHYWTDERLPPFNINSVDHKSAVLFGGDIKIQETVEAGFFKNGNPKFKKQESAVHITGFHVPTTLTTPSKKIGFYKTDDGVMKAIAAGTKNPELKKYCELQKDAMMYKKAAKTYCQAFLDRSDENGYLFPNFNNCLTQTGRLSSSEPNMQNISKRNKFGEILHKLLVVPEGWKAVSIDFSQLEIWVLAWLSADPILTDDLLKGTDLHIKRLQYYNDKTYEELYDLCKVKQDDYWNKQRTYAKTVSYQMAYGAQPKKVAESTGLDLEIVKTIFEKEAETYQGAAELALRVRAEIENNTTYSKAVDIPASSKRGVNGNRVLGNVELLPVFDNKGNISYTNQEIRKVGYWRSPTGKKYHFLDTGRMFKGKLKRSFSFTQPKNYPMQGCLHGDTKVFTKEHGMSSIKDLLLENINVWDVHGYSKASCIYSGIKEEIIVSFSDGNTIKCSPNHKFKYVNPSTLYEGWITAENMITKLADGKRVAIKLADEVDFNKNVSFALEVGKKPGNYIHRSFDAIEDMHRLGCVIGRIASDGSVREGKEVVLIIAEHEEAITNVLLEYIKPLGNVGVTRVLRENRNQHITKVVISSNSLAQEAVEFKKRVPIQCWENKELLRGYLKGMFDGDGTVTPRDNSVILTFGKGAYKVKWALEIQIALRLFGIRSRVRRYKDRTLVCIMKADSPTFRDKIGFINKIKQDKLSDRGTSRQKHNISYVKSIKRTGNFVDMYDIVNSETGSFCANGVVTHNSAADVQAITTAALLKILLEKSDRIKMVNEVHDSKWFYIREDVLEPCLRYLKETIENVPKLMKDRFNITVPFNFPCDIDIGDNFGEMEKYNFNNIGV